jgi:hypothetical protein
MLDWANRYVKNRPRKPSVSKASAPNTRGGG